MRNIWREYGVIGILLVVAVGGYFLLGENRGDILFSSLDAIGNRLTALVDDDSRKEDVADAFSEFKDRVASKEIAPEQIEAITANILNLTASGESLSPEEAEMVLDLALEPLEQTLPVPRLSGGAISAPTESITPFPRPREVDMADISDERYEALGSRVAAMVTFAERVKEVAASDESVRNIEKHYQFAFQNGLRVVVDTMAESIWSRDDFRELTSEMDREEWVDWRQNLVEEKLVRDKRIKGIRNRISVALSQDGVVVDRSHDEHEALIAMERLTRLQELGLVVKMDTSMLSVRLEMSIQEVMKELEESIEAAKAAASTGSKIESN